MTDPGSPQRRQVSDSLIASRMPIKHICAQLGYADEAALHRSFKQATGMTTGQYRQLYARSA
ncbi:MAG: helix-turn-helix domain-containing protein [Polaromonas sp.]